MIHDNKQVIDLMKYMTELGFDFEILGGYPRDLYFGRTPKDMDICCFNCKPDTVLWRDKFIKLKAYLTETGTYRSDFAVSEDYPSDRIFGGLSTRQNVDIIFWQEKFTSATSILDWFDYNINQFRLGCDDNCNLVGEPYEHMFNFGRLKQLRETELTPERIQKTLKLARDVGWLEESHITALWGGVY